jgi:hypothetical protein
MRLEFDPRLLEESVFHALRRDGQRMAAERSSFHLRADELYQLKDAVARERAFQALNRETFVRLGLQRAIDDALSFFPRLDTALERLVFVYAERRKDEEVELFSQQLHDWTAVFRVRTETLINGERFRGVALHELSHVDDMLNPEFRYSRSQFALNMNSQQLDMVKERYRCLWDLYIDARLAMRDERPQQQRDGHELNFLRLFGVSTLTRNIFELLWKLQFAHTPDSCAFIQAAQTPENLLRLAGLQMPAQERADGLRRFADVCPLCGCPTVEWINDVHQVSHEVQALIREKFPAWTANTRFCRQCEEIFRTQAALSTAHSQEQPR